MYTNNLKMTEVGNSDFRFLLNITIDNIIVILHYTNCKSYKLPCKQGIPL